MPSRSLTRTQADVATGAYLASRRLRLGVTQDQLAADLTDMTGYRWTQAKVSSAESGRNPMTTSQVCAMAAALGVHPRKALEVSLETTGTPSELHPGEVMAWEVPVERLSPATLARSVSHG